MSDVKCTMWDELAMGNWQREKQTHFETILNQALTA